MPPLVTTLKIFSTSPTNVASRCLLSSRRMRELLALTCVTRLWSLPIGPCFCYRRCCSSSELLREVLSRSASTCSESSYDSEKSCCASSIAALLTPKRIVVHTRLNIWPAQRSLDLIGSRVTRFESTCKALSLLVALSAAK
jgi:hypothetical protein